jgi:N utilization substance protein B
MSTERPRTLARVAAVQALYQGEQTNETAETVIDQFVRHRLTPHKLPPTSPLAHSIENGLSPHANAPLFARIVRLVTTQQDQIDPLIANLLPESWPMPRLDPVLRALLRAAAAELWMSDGPPARVVINEYLDIAHGFFADDAVQLANALLDRIARALRPADFPSPSAA